MNRGKTPFSKIFLRTIGLLFPLQWTLLSTGFSLTEEEKVTIEVYKKASVSVAHIRSTVVRFGFLFQPIPARGMGSGVILDQRGHIVTNAHVVERATEMEVTLFDGSIWKGKLVGSIPEKDLAIIRIEAPPEKLNPVEMGDSRSLHVGQTVYAIGNPFGFQQTLTKGVISSLNRSLVTPQGAKLEDLIQTDAAINPGNSGGPLLDGQGRLVGINTAILSPSGVSSGVGFAIPTAALEKHLPSLMAKGNYRWPWPLILVGAVIILWILWKRIGWRRKW